MDNYTGPYWSNGRLQESVEFGEAVPLSELDVQSRLHDSAYAHFKDQQHRRAADVIYYERTRGMGPLAEVAGDTVLFGNQLLRAGKNIGIDGDFYDIVKGGVLNAADLDDWMMNKSQYLGDVRSFYDTDPFRATHQHYPPGAYVPVEFDRNFGLRYPSVKPKLGVNTGPAISRAEDNEPKRWVRWAPRRRRRRQLSTKQYV